MSIRLHSTVESVRQGNITVLAIVETILAVSISIFIAVSYETLIHIAVSACIAPLLLLRTKESTERGLRWFENIIRIFEPIYEISDYLRYQNMLGWSRSAINEFIDGAISKIISLLLITAYVFLAIILGVLIKLIAVTYTLMSRPIHTILAIPNNWKRVTLSTDILYPPELLPGLEEKQDLDNRTESEIRFEEMLSDIRFGKSSEKETRYTLLSRFSFRKTAREVNQFSDNLTGPGDSRFNEYFLPSLFSRLPMVIVNLWLLTASVMFSFSYRWALKSTSFIYAPFAWILNSSIAIGKNLRDYLFFAARSALGQCH